MIFLIDPDSALLERSNILSEDSELNIAAAQSSRVSHDHYVSSTLLGRSQSYDLLVSLPL